MLLTLHAAAPDYTSFQGGRIKEVDYDNCRVDPLYHKHRVFSMASPLFPENWYPEKIVFAFHGMGDCSINILKALPVLRNTLYIAPQGPQRMRIWGAFAFNYQWFDIGSIDKPDETKIRKGIENNRAFLTLLIRDVVQQFRVSYHRVFLFGFSQGGIQACDLLLNIPEVRYAFLVSYVADLQSLIRLDDKKVLSFYNRYDTIVPAEKTRASEAHLIQQGATVVSHHISIPGNMFESHICTLGLAMRHLNNFIENPNP